MLTEAIATRLGTIDGLAGVVKTAADLSELVRTKQLPNTPVAAFVVPGGLRPLGRPDTATGAYTHELMEIVAVVLMVRTAADATGGKSLVRLEPLIQAVLESLCGFEPEDVADEASLPIGPVEFSRAQIVSMAAGTIIYQVEVAAPLQLRILA